MFFRVFLKMPVNCKLNTRGGCDLGTENPHITATFSLDTQRNISFEWFQMAPIHKHILTNCVRTCVEQLYIDVRARSVICEIQRCCLQGLRFPHVQSGNRQLLGSLRQLLFWGAMCFRGFGVPRRILNQPLHRVAPWLSHVHDEPHEGTTTFKKMIACRSKSQTRPPGADALPPSYSANAQQTN